MSAEGAATLVQMSPALEQRLKTLEDASAERRAESMLHAQGIQHLRELVTTQNASVLSILEDIKRQQADLQQALNDPQRSPIGRALTEDVADVRTRVTVVEQNQHTHRSWFDQMRGALNIAKFLGGGGLATAIVALAKAFGWL